VSCVGGGGDECHLALVAVLVMLLVAVALLLAFLALLAESQLHTSLSLGSSSKLHLLHSQLSISPQEEKTGGIDPSNMHYHNST
jgi:hypothetical protein